jgi:hypothetical protein
MTARIAHPFLLLATALLPVTIPITPAYATTTCPADPSKAIAEARKALGSEDRSKDREALACLADAVAALDAKLDDLIAGKIIFTAPVTAKGGFIQQGDEPVAKGAH